ncbi:MAG: prefoldin subunit beta [Candidatus Thorarchaeota archaeon]
MAQNIPPALEQELQKFDTMRRNHETLTAMSQTLQAELTEVKGTLEELKKQADDTVTYKAVGQVMFKVEQPAVVEELEDREKTIEMRLASTTKQTEKLAEQLKELQTKIELELSKRNLRLQ